MRREKDRVDKRERQIKKGYLEKKIDDERNLDLRERQSKKEQHR